MKKLLILLTVLTLVFSSLPSVSAQNNSDAQKLSLLCDLGIIAPNFERIYLSDAKITVGEMLSVMQNIMFSNKYGTYDDEQAFNDAVNSGYFGADKIAKYYDNAKYEYVFGNRDEHSRLRPYRTAKRKLSCKLHFAQRNVKGAGRR